VYVSCVCVCIRTRTHTACGVLGCQPGCRDETPGEPGRNPGYLHDHVHPVTLQRGKRHQAYQGGVGRSPTNFFFPLFIIIFFGKNDSILSKRPSINHDKKEKKLCTTVIEHIEMISEWSIEI